ncbi:hypothetical protein F5884DRAFT_838128 [Xylogone sp. PMI_703]|nr:hypothetical protein F5884DRAFT_838128 [Xylogone sp. PMI_703]
MCGYASQANYSAGGSFEDILTEYRTMNGLPGVAVDIGIVKSVGYVAETEGTSERLIGKSGLCCLDLAQNSGNTNETGSTDLLSKIAAATSFEEAVQIVMKGINKKLMDIFVIEEAEVNPAKSLSSYGVDSLVAVELRNMPSLRAEADISIFNIMQSSSIASLAATVASKSSHINPSLIPYSQGDTWAEAVIIHRVMHPIVRLFYMCMLGTICPWREVTEIIAMKCLLDCDPLQNFIDCF